MESQPDVMDNLNLLSDTITLDDKVALVFLLSNNLEQSLHLIKTFQISDSVSIGKLFHQFLIECCDNLCDQLIESLHVIKNFKAIRVLGITKEKLNECCKKNTIDPTRKRLYHLAEKLTQKETTHLIASVSGHLKPNCRYLEEVFLEWDRDKLISLGFNNAPVRIDNITESLSEFDNVETVFDRNENKNENNSHSEMSEYYPIIDKNDVGLCVVINQKTFTRNDELSHLMPQHDLPPRMGSEKDVEAIENVFTKMGFRVRTHSNVVFEKLRNLLPEYARSIPSHHSCFLLCVMSHGTENVFYTSDSVPVSVDSIEMAFQRNNCPKLVGKPKILVIQACQGSDLQQTMMDNVNGSTTLDNMTLGPERGDALIAWSTVKGYASFRDRYQGSWFIQHLCEELAVSAGTRDLVDIITRVNGLLRTKTCNGMFMVPALSSSLCKKIRLPYTD